MSLDKGRLFVRNLPYTATREQLEEVFGDIGPVRKVDLIGSKGSHARGTEEAVEEGEAPRLTKGFAFIKFAMDEDAETALKQLNNTSFQGRTMRIEFAKKKKGAPVSQEEEQASVEAPAPAQEPQEQPAVSQQKTQKTPVKANEKNDKAASKKTKQKSSARQEQSERNQRRRLHRAWLREIEKKKEAAATNVDRSLVVYGLTNNISKKEMIKRFKRYGPVSQVERKLMDDEDETNEDAKIVVHVEFKKLNDVNKALAKMNKQEFRGCTMQVRKASSQKTLAEPAKADSNARLIVRNLSFQAVEADLAKLFSPYGPLAEVKVVRMPVETPDEEPENDEAAEESKPQTPAALGRSRGFGFVHFQVVEDAAAAVDALNNTRLKGREFVVDFALSKTQYLSQQQEEATSAVKSTDEDEEGENEDAEGASDVEEDEGSEKDEGDDNEENEDEDEENSEGEEEENEEVLDGPKQSKKADDSEEDLYRTLFLRNVSFQSSEESITAVFQQFGAVQYTKIVFDRNTGLSKGVAFVRFKNSASADAALARATENFEASKKKKKKNKTSSFLESAMNDGMGIEVDGRLISISRAVTRNNASRLAEENIETRKQRDKRNLYLSQEGYIKTNDNDGDELPMPKLDIEKRQRASKEKKEKLKDPLNFISPTRLSVRSLRTTLGDSDLKKLFREAAIEGLREKVVTVDEIKQCFRPEKPMPVKITFAKVVRDMESITASNKEAKSRGFGFVEFTEHMHAMAALRILNNNPKYTEYTNGGSKNNAKKRPENQRPRLIIEFAVENHGKIKQREKRVAIQLKKKQERDDLKRAQAPEEDATPKKSRGRRQRENKRGRKDTEDGEEKPASAKKAKIITTAPKAKAPVQSKRKAAGEIGLDGLETSTLTKKSRKGKKQVKEKEEERDFEKMVRSYKSKVFGALEEKESTGRWFD